MTPSELLMKKPCVKCGTCDRSPRGACRPCGRAATAAWTLKNPEKRKAQLSEWQKLNPEKSRAAHTKWALSNPEKVRANSKIRNIKTKDQRKVSDAKRYAQNPERCKAVAAAWKAANPEKMKESAQARRLLNPEKLKNAAAAWRAANPEKVKAGCQAYRKKYPEKIRINSHNRRAKKRANGGRLTPGLSLKLFKLQKGKCTCCGISLGDNYHMDHIMPLALGGSNTDQNIQLLRSVCNAKKHAKHPIDYMQQKGFLL